jgi:ankyrin repeat protein
MPLTFTDHINMFDLTRNNEPNLLGDLETVPLLGFWSDFESTNLLANALISDDPPDLDDLALTAMASTTAAPATLFMDSYQPISDSLMMMNGLITHILPAVQQLMRKIHVPIETLSEFPAERFFHPHTAQLLRGQSIDMQILHLITSRLTNNLDPLFALRNPQSSVDKLYKAGVEHLFTLDARLLNGVFDLMPAPYNAAFEQGLFCAAVEMGAARTVATLLKRGININRPFYFCQIVEPFKFSQISCYPLERSCAGLYIELTRLLLEAGADPSQHTMENPLKRLLWPGSDGYIDTGAAYSPAAFEILTLLFNCGAKTDLMSSALLHPYVLEKCNSNMLWLWVSNSNDAISISGRYLPLIIERNILDEKVLRSIRSILEQYNPDHAERSKRCQEILAASLTKATFNGHMEVIELLLAAGAVPMPDCLLGAVRSADLQLVERFLDLGFDPNFSIRADSSGRRYTTAMSECIAVRFGEAFQAFVCRGFVAKLRDCKQSFRPTLVAACTVGDEKMVDYLLSLQKGDWMEDLGKAVTAAIKASRKTIVEKLLVAGINIDDDTLHDAIRTRDASLVDLVMKGFTYRGLYKRLPPEAIAWGNTTLIAELINAGCDLDDHDVIAKYGEGFELPQDLLEYFPIEEWNVTPLTAAILKRDREVINLLLDSGAQVNVPGSNTNRWNVTTLAAATINQDLKLIAELLGRGADPFDNFAITIAAVLGNEDCLKKLLDAFARRYSHGAKSFGARALFWAIKNGKERMITLLLQIADANCLVYERKSKKHSPGVYLGLERGKSPLGAAIDWDRGLGRPYDVLSRLLQRGGGDPDSVVFWEEDNGAKTALLYAIELESLKAIQVLIEARANIALPARFGIRRTPLQAAAEVGNEEILAYLLQRGADLNEAPAARAGATALQLAAIQGHVGIATTLLDAKADINAEPAMIHGRTAFEGATEYGRIDMMLFLFQNGADLLSNDQRQYRRAIQFAEKNHQYAAKQCADQLLIVALGNSGTRTMGEGHTEMPVLDMDSFSEFVSFDN